MRVYLSGGFGGQAEIAVLAEALSRFGHEVTSNWLKEPQVYHDDDESHRRWMRGLGNEDVEDIRRADAVVMFTFWPSTTGGRHVELGIGIGMTVANWRKQLVVVGPAEENVFQHLSMVRFVESSEGRSPGDLASDINAVLE